MENFKWLNESKMTESQGKITILATDNSDFFNRAGGVSKDGITPESLSNAPYYYTDVTGDFVLTAKVSHDFKHVYDAAALLIHENNNLWAKACFELTDFDTHAVVSVVTNKFSDDANGCNINGNSCWLKAARLGDVFGFYYSTDGSNFYMMRVFGLPVGKTVKVGLLAQAPAGADGERRFEDIVLENKSVVNIRAGK